jgi:hypothetical protein
MVAATVQHVEGLVCLYADGRLANQTAGTVWVGGCEWVGGWVGGWVSTRLPVLCEFVRCMVRGVCVRARVRERVSVYA